MLGSCFAIIFCQNKHYVAMLGYHLREACLVTYLWLRALLILWSERLDQKHYGDLGLKLFSEAFNLW